MSIISVFFRNAVIYDSDDKNTAHTVKIVSARAVLGVICCLIAAAAIVFSLFIEICDLFSPVSISKSALNELCGSLGIQCGIITAGGNKTGYDDTGIGEYLSGLYDKNEYYSSAYELTKGIYGTNGNLSGGSSPADGQSGTETYNGEVYKIAAQNLCPSGEAKDIVLSNETSYTPDLSALLKAKYPIDCVLNCFSGTLEASALRSLEPVVLIIHTHGTEAYMPEGCGTYTADESFRSENTSENIVAVGAEMTKTLISLGIPTVHCEIMHDKESYMSAYSRAAKTISGYLAKYPSIRYVFDVHRDSIIRPDGTAIKPITSVSGISSAQVMSVVGTDEMGACHPNWLDNLNVAVKLQYLLNSEYTDLARPINLRGAGFNEQYTSGSLILEIGSCANTLSEAKTAGRLTAVCLAKLISGDYST